MSFSKNICDFNYFLGKKIRENFNEIKFGSFFC